MALLLFKIVKTYKESKVKENITTQTFRVLMKVILSLIKVPIKGINDDLSSKRELILQCYTDMISRDEMEELKKLLIGTTDDIEYPDKFLDPILCTLISDPVLIPEINVFFDRSTIERQISREPVHPYTKKELTKEILDSYNEKEEVKKKVQEFKSDFEQFVKKYREEHH